ncbi:MAG: N-6 DNA methylase [Promethearchaeota archaeon]
MTETPKEFTKENKRNIIRKRDLIKSPNLKKTFVSINNHLYGKLKYADTDTRARSKEIINLLLCKLVDEVNKSPEDEMEIYIREGETEKELLERIQTFFQQNVKKKYLNIMGENEQITLNKDLLFIIIKELEQISLLKSSKDILSDAFEIFVSKMLKDEGGQFFTPPNIVKFMVNYLDPEEDSKVLDPACGHGGFLLETKELLWSKIDNEQKKVRIISNLHGIDKDLFLARICKLYLEILSSGKSNVFCEDSLDPFSYRDQAKKIIKTNYFDSILTNPPFGAKIPINNQQLLTEYEFGHIWKNIDGNWQKQVKIVKQQPPQILFIERCVQLLKDGGKLGIVLPEGIFGNPSDRYIWEFLKSNGKILGIVSLDQNTFQPYTCNKTSILFFQKLKDIPDDYKIDFAIINNVGHDKDGKTQYFLNKDGTKKLDKDKNPIINDDLIDLHIKLKNSEDFNYQKEQKLFKINSSQVKNNIMIPSYYIGVEKPLKALENNEDFQLISIRDLITKKIIYTKNRDFLPRGVEIGSSVYGLGSIPFVRTSDINNWEIDLDSHKKTSEEVYNQFKTKQKIEVGDILLVKDGGPNLIGKTAYITELDTRIIIQSHIFQIKILENKENIDSYLILHLLNLDIVQKQIRAITFVQGTISTIGNRILDVKLPFPTNLSKRINISNYIKEIIKNKTEIRKKIYNLSLDSFDD